MRSVNTLIWSILNAAVIILLVAMVYFTTMALSNCARDLDQCIPVDRSRVDVATPVMLMP